MHPLKISSHHCLPPTFLPDPQQEEILPILMVKHMGSGSECMGFTEVWSVIFSNLVDPFESQFLDF